jgi:hypothetical protein
MSTPPAGSQMPQPHRRSNVQSVQNLPQSKSLAAVFLGLPTQKLLRFPFFDPFRYSECSRIRRLFYLDYVPQLTLTLAQLMR